MCYLELFRALQEQKVRYLVVGGVAVNLHGIGRLTVDIDLMRAFALRSSDPATPTVGVLVKPVVPFDDAWARRVQRAVENVAIPIAAIEDIIRLKTGTGRQKDEADIKALRQLLRMEPAKYAS
jgi:predicted nucleotidyltransferase